MDLVIGIALEDETPETYRTLENNLKKAGFEPGDVSFRWVRDVEGVTVKMEFLCETDRVEPGRIFKPKGEGVGANLGAFNVRGARLLPRDFIEHEIEGERLDGGGVSRIKVRVANLLPYTVLKIRPSRTATRTKTPTISSSASSTAKLIRAPLAEEPQGARSPVSQSSQRRSISFGDVSRASIRTGRRHTPPSWPRAVRRKRVCGCAVRRWRSQASSWMGLGGGPGALGERELTSSVDRDVPGS